MRWWWLLLAARHRALRVFVSEAAQRRRLSEALPDLRFVDDDGDVVVWLGGNLATLRSNLATNETRAVFVDRDPQWWQEVLGNRFVVSTHSKHRRLFVLFGCPGAGKSTIADAVALDRQIRLLDGDCCVPQWMRDNFALGIYPTQDQRAAFAADLVHYVDRVATGDALLTFSFVNDDLRDVFRAACPDAAWVLVDTDKTLAATRVAQRDGHFYKPPPLSRGEHHNDEWAFAPVSFPHARLDGRSEVPHNTRILRRFLDSPILLLDLAEEASGDDDDAVVSAVRASCAGLCSGFLRHPPLLARPEASTTISPNPNRG